MDAVGTGVAGALTARMRHTYTDTTTITVADPLDAIGHIADAAVTALESA